MVHKKIQNLVNHGFENRALVRNKEWVSEQTQLGQSTLRPLVFKSNPKIYTDSTLISAICTLIGAICTPSQVSYV